MIERRGALRVLLIVALTLAPFAPTEAAAPAITGSNATSAGHAGHAEPPPSVLDPMSASEMQGYGCLAAGGASLVMTALAGTNEMILVFGGSVTPTTPAGAAVAVSGLIFASVCAVGALVTPAAVRLWRYYYDGARLAPSP